MSVTPNRRRRRRAALVLASAPLLLAAPLAAQGNPLKLAPRSTAAAISEEDLKTRLYIFADDSMQGRQFGREGNFKGTEYIARELKKLGVEPGGENGTYFQGLPAVQRKYTEKSSLTVDGRPLRWLADFVAVPGRATPRAFSSAEVIFGGIVGDTLGQISAEQARGKLVILATRPAAAAQPQQFRGGMGGMQRFTEAAAIATADLDALGDAARAALNNTGGSWSAPRPGQPVPQPVAPTLRITTEAAAQLLGRPLAGLAPGSTGRKVNAQLEYVEVPVPQFARNVIGIIRGSDPKLAGQYIAIGSHNDHVGFATPVDHDSARAFATAALRASFRNGEIVNLTPEERAAIRVNVDSLRALRPARRDSVNNGADDDGSGSMAILEMAEAIVRAPVKPRRSILFVWHTGEEAGLLGSRYFTDNPTVPRDSIVAQLNVDMIGRGAAGDLPPGSPDYLAVVGANRLSSELGKAVADINAKQARPLTLDYRFDENTTWPGYNNIYGRSDHANYARFDIPIAFFFTGLHQDYHRPTDEAQYIDYPHFARITQYIHDLALELANRDRRPVVDKPNTN